SPEPGVPPTGSGGVARSEPTNGRFSRRYAPSGVPRPSGRPPGQDARRTPPPPRGAGNPARDRGNGLSRGRGSIAESRSLGSMPGYDRPSPGSPERCGEDSMTDGKRGGAGAGAPFGGIYLLTIIGAAVYFI